MSGGCRDSCTATGYGAPASPVRPSRPSRALDGETHRAIDLRQASVEGQHHEPRGQPLGRGQVQSVERADDVLAGDLRSSLELWQIDGDHVKPRPVLGQASPRVLLLLIEPDPTQCDLCLVRARADATQVASSVMCRRTSAVPSSSRYRFRSADVSRKTISGHAARAGPRSWIGRTGPRAASRVAAASARSAR